MPTILQVLGWRVFFYADEGNEPIHVHAQKGGAECKVWLHVDRFDIEFAWEHGLTPRLRRELRRILFEHFDVLVAEWDEFQRRRQHEGH